MNQSKFSLKPMIPSVLYIVIATTIDKDTATSTAFEPEPFPRAVRSLSNKDASVEKFSQPVYNNIAGIVRIMISMDKTIFCDLGWTPGAIFMAKISSLIKGRESSHISFPYRDISSDFCMIGTLMLYSM